MAAFRHRINNASRRRLDLGIAALLVGALGEILLLQPGLEIPGTGLLLAAMALAAAAWGAPTKPRAEQAVAPVSRKLLPWRLLGIAAAIVAMIGGWLAWFADPNAIFGWQGWLWLLSMALLVASCARWYPAGEDRGAGPEWGRAEALVFVGLVALALATRLIDLDGVPWRFHYDEAIAFTETTRFARGPLISLFTTTWYQTTLPSLWFAIAGGLMRLAGDGLGAVRLGVALGGAVAVIPIYGIARLVGGRVAAALAAFAWATVPVAVHYSRISINNITTGTAWAVCFYFLLRGLKSRRPNDFVWSGLAGGLSMYTFYGSRLLPYLLIAFVVALALFQRRLLRELVGQFALLALGFVVGFGPLLAYFMRYPALWAGRGIDELNVPPELPLSIDRIVGDIGILAPLAARNFLSLSAIPSKDGFYWDPFLPPAFAVLLLLGVGIMLRRWRDPASMLLLGSIAGVLFVGGTLIDAGHIPAFNHWSPVVPLFFVVLALPAAAFLRPLRGLGRPAWLGGAVALAGGSAVVALLAGYNYLVVYPTKVPASFEFAQGRYMESLPAGSVARFVGNSWLPYFDIIGAMLAPHVRGGDFLNPSRELPLHGPPPDQMAFVFNEDETQYLPLVQSYYPGGVTGRIPTPGGPIGLTYTIGGTQAMAGHGVMLALKSAAGYQALPEPVAQIGALPANASLNRSADARWSGTFYISRKEQYTITSSNPAARIVVQGREIALGASLALDPGWVPFSLSASLAAPVKSDLLIAAGGAPPTNIDPLDLWPLAPDAGLAVATSAGSTRIDPFVGASFFTSGPEQGIPGYILPPQQRDPDFLPLGPQAGAGHTMRWQGTLTVSGGSYGMELRSDARARLTIDGATVLQSCDFDATPNGAPIRGGYTGPTTIIQLSPGPHEVVLDLEASGETSGLEWTWTRPDGVREIVPPSALNHGDADLWPQAPASVVCD